MNDFDTLSDAFGELERRADLATDAYPYEFDAGRQHSRAPLIALSVVASPVLPPRPPSSPPGTTRGTRPRPVRARRSGR